MAERYDSFITTDKSDDDSTEAFRYHRTLNKTSGIKGFRKLVQRWVKCFLTRAGTDPTDPEYGTNLPNIIGGNITSKQNVKFSIQSAVQTANNKVRKQQRKSDLSEDERLEKATLDDYDVDVENATFSVYVTITSKSGRSRPLFIPVGEQFD